jgi:transcriptional regulator with XRE-family HTH domain
MSGPDSPRTRFGQHLRRLRAAAHMTQASLGAFAHVSSDAVATWEKGRSLPDQATAARLDQRLAADGALLQAWREALSDSRSDRGTVGSAVGVSAASLLATAAREAAEFGAWAERLNVGDVAITSLAVRARDMSEACLTAPPADVIARAADLNREAFALLRGHHRPTHARDLYTIAGQTCALLTWLSGDLGALDAARVHGSAAQVCADHAEQPELSAWVAAVRSKTAFWCGDYPAAAELASRGLTLAPPGTAAVMLACQAADAYAKLGARDRAMAALTRAEDEAQRQRGADTLGGLFACGPARHANYAAAALLTLGDPAPALAAADRALAGFAADARYGFGTVAQTHLTRALAFAATADLDGAQAAARPVLDLPPGRRLATLTERLRPLAAILSRPAMRTSTVAGPLREEITEFCGAPGQRQLTSGHPRRTGD